MIVVSKHILKYLYLLFFCSRKNDTDFVCINSLVNDNLNTGKIICSLALTSESKDQARLPIWISRLHIVL